MPDHAPYGADPLVIDMARAFAADPAWASRFDGAPEVLGVESFGETGVKIRALLRTMPGVQGEVAREFRRRIVIRLEREGIKGARPQQTININQSAAMPRPSVEVVTTTAEAAPGSTAPPVIDNSPIPGTS